MIRRLADEVEKLRKENEELRRKRHRQAAPFTKGVRKPDPKKPGRRKGEGQFKKREAPPVGAADVRVEVSMPERCRCGGQVKLERIEEATMADVPPVPAPVVRRYAVPVCRCKACGGVVRGQSAGLTSMAALSTRFFIVQYNNNCGVAFNATAYVLNVTAVPKKTLGYLTLWPGGVNSVRPTVSTLNAVTGAVTANMAIVPPGAGLSGISAYVTEDTDLVIDIAGYFATPGQPNALLFTPVVPCRALDTRLGAAADIAAGSSREIPAPCGAPAASARAYAVNATVVPPGILGYLTLYPTATSRPGASTLNAADGALTSNAAIVPAGLNGAITAYMTERTHLILDVNGYFAK